MLDEKSYKNQPKQDEIKMIKRLLANDYSDFGKNFLSETNLKKLADEIIENQCVDVIVEDRKSVV